jgi:hypothetical protein
MVFRAAFQAADRKVWAIRARLRQARKKQRARASPRREGHEWVLSLYDMPPPLRWAMSRGHAAFLGLSRTEACQKLRGAEPPPSVTFPKIHLTIRHGTAYK